jgi:GST-like protein
MLSRPAVQRGINLGKERRHDLSKDKEAQKILFGQKSR